MNKSRLTTAVVNVLFAATLAAAAAGNSAADSGPASVRNGSTSIFSPTGDMVSSLQARFGDELVLVGQVDAFSDAGEAIVLGQRVVDSAGPGLAVVGNARAVISQARNSSR